MLQKMKAVAAKLLAPKKTQALRIVHVPRLMLFAACAAVLLSTAGCLGITAGDHKVVTYYPAPQEPPPYDMDNSYAEDRAPDAEGFLRSQGFWHDESREGRDGERVYCRGDNCIEVEQRGKIVLGTDKQFQKYHYTTPEGKRKEGVIGYYPPGTIKGGKTGRWQFAPGGLTR